MPLFSSYGPEKGVPPISPGGSGLPSSSQPKTLPASPVGALRGDPMAHSRCSACPPTSLPPTLGQDAHGLTLTFFSISSRTRLCCSAMARVALWTRW